MGGEEEGVVLSKHYTCPSKCLTAQLKRATAVVGQWEGGVAGADT